MLHDESQVSPPHSPFPSAVSYVLLLQLLLQLLHSLTFQVKPIWRQKARKQPHRPSVGLVHSHLPILNQILVAPVALCCL